MQMYDFLVFIKLFYRNCTQNYKRMNCVLFTLRLQRILKDTYEKKKIDPTA